MQSRMKAIGIPRKILSLPGSRDGMDIAIGIGVLIRSDPFTKTLENRLSHRGGRPLAVNLGERKHHRGDDRRAALQFFALKQHFGFFLVWVRLPEMYTSLLKSLSSGF